MRPYPQFPADLITFNEEILNGKIHFLCSAFKQKGKYWEDWLKKCFPLLLREKKN